MRAPRKAMLVDTDWWTDCDDAVAVRILAKAELSETIQIFGIGLNACMEHSVPSLDGFLTLEGLPRMPIGIDRAATDFGGNPPYQKRLAAYAKNYRSNDDAEDAVRLYRRILAQEPWRQTHCYHTIDIVELGYPQVLAGLLASEGDDLSPLNGVELVRNTVGTLWMMAGNWEKNPGKENNFARNARAARAAAYVCEHCPVPIVFLGYEVGATVISGSKLQPGDHLHQVLADHGSPHGRSSWDPMLAELAANLHGPYDLESGFDYGVVRGFAAVDAESGANYFHPDPEGPHRYVVKCLPDSFYADRIDSVITPDDALGDE